MERRPLFFAIQLSKIKLAHSSATFQVRKHTFKASVACNGREVLHGTPEGRHGISAREAADCLGNREPSTADRCAERVPPVGWVPENTSRPALCGASPWGGLVARLYSRVAANHMPPGLRGGENHTPLINSRQKRKKRKISLSENARDNDFTLYLSG